MTRGGGRSPRVGRVNRPRALVPLLALGCALAVAASSTGPFLEPDRDPPDFQVRRIPRVRIPIERRRAEDGDGLLAPLRAIFERLDLLFQGLVILVGAVALLWGLYLFGRALLALVRLRLRRSRGLAPEEYDPGEESYDDAESVLRRRVADELRLLSADLAEEADPREAVIACYVRMERALADAGTPRAAAETPLELLRRVLASYAVPEADVRRLTDLFTEARFSHHPVTDEMRRAARRSLDAVSDALGAGAAR